MNPLSPSRARVVAALLVLGPILAGCSSDSGDDVSEVTVEAVLEQSADAMAEVESASFAIEQTGADVFIDDADRIRFGGATGRYGAPASAEALLSVTAMGLATEVGAVAIDGQIWITNPLTGDWEEAPEGFSFDPSVLFDEDTGWSALLTDGLQNPELVTDAGDRYHIRALVDADRVAVLTGGLVDESSEVDLWIDAETDLVDELAFDVETSAGPTAWKLALSEYGADVTITEPDLEATD